MKTLNLPAETQNLEGFIAFIIEEAKRAGVSGGALDHINLACEEALVNIVSYAYDEGYAAGYINVTCDTDDLGRFVVEISDEGVPFNPLEKDDPDFAEPIESREIGGLGVFLLKRVVDEVSYERRDGRNVLTLIKKVEERCF